MNQQQPNSQLNDNNLIAIKNNFILFTDEDEEEQEEHKQYIQNKADQHTQQLRQQLQINSQIPQNGQKDSNSHRSNPNLQQYQQNQIPFQQQNLQYPQYQNPPNTAINVTLNPSSNNQINTHTNTNNDQNNSNNNSSIHVINLSQNQNHLNDLQQQQETDPNLSFLSSQDRNQNRNNNNDIENQFDEIQQNADNLIEKMRILQAISQVSKLRFCYLIFVFLKLFSCIFGGVALMQFLKYDYHNSQNNHLSERTLREQMGILIFLIIFDIIELLYFINLFRYCGNLIKNIDPNHPLFQDMLYSDNLYLKHVCLLKQQSCLVGKWLGRIIFIAELVIYWYITATQLEIGKEDEEDKWYFQNEVVQYYIEYSMLFCELLIFFLNVLQIIFILYVLYYFAQWVVQTIKKKYAFNKLEKYLKGQPFQQFLDNYRNTIMANNQNLDEPHECSICMEQYQNNEYIVNIKCQGNHHFHSECVKPWIQQTMTCPICRDTITENNFL